MTGMIVVYGVVAVLVAGVFLLVWGIDRRRTRKQAHDHPKHMDSR